MTIETAAKTHARESTRELATFAANLSFERIPLEVVDKIKDSVADTLGCCLFGSTLESVRKLAGMVEGEAGSGPCSVFGFPFLTSPSHAALINGASAHAFQLDEIHVGATLHPGSVGIPAAFATAEALCGVSGRRLITALVAANEIGIRVGLAAKSGMFARGFHNQGTTGVFVAAAAAAGILGLDAKQTHHALGIAGSQGAGLMAVQEGAMTKSFHSGRAAQSGVYAAKLAQQGYTGIPNVLEAQYGGFLSSLVGDFDEQPLTGGLGEQWETLRIGFKPAPASNGSITAMSAMDRIMREHRLSADDVAAVKAYVSTNTAHHCGWAYEPDKLQGVLAAQMNLRYGIAVMALERCATVEQFTESKMRNPAILDFIARVNVEIDPKFDAEAGKYRVGCRVEVLCRNGKKHEAEVLFRKGSFEDPMTRKDLHGKFMRLAQAALPRTTAARLHDQVQALDSIENVGGIAILLRGAP